jgi:aerobic-type carbon monoxide dehydrogenase small subunit (CoxS/CutS family)
VNVTVTLTVNAIERTISTDPDRPLLDVLREEFDLTGTKYGCGEGRCGACTVLMDGRPIRSCITPITAADQKSILTIEGLADGQSLHPVQEAFLEEGAMQCGYCTPGIILSAVALLEQHPDPTDEEIISGMDGHICRCNGYVKIMTAIRRAAGMLQRKQP